MPTPVHWLGYCRNRSPHPLSLHSRWGGSVPPKTFSSFFLFFSYSSFSLVGCGRGRESCAPALWRKHVVSVCLPGGSNSPSYEKGKKVGEKIMTRLGTNLYQVHTYWIVFKYFQLLGINHLIPQNGASFRNTQKLLLGSSCVPSWWSRNFFESHLSRGGSWNCSCEKEHVYKLLLFFKRKVPDGSIGPFHPLRPLVSSGRS